jgi:two-component sensor histidine kinase
MLQLRQSVDPSARAALKEAVGRVKAVSIAYEKLALSSEGLETVRLQDHLQELCDQLADGIPRSNCTPASNRSRSLMKRRSASASS